MKVDEIITKIWKQAHDLGKRGYEINHIPVNDIKRHLTEWALGCVPDCNGTYDYENEAYEAFVAGYSQCSEHFKKNIKHSAD